MLQAALDFLFGIVEGEQTGTLLLVLAFVAATSAFLFASLLVSPALETRQRIRQQLFESGIATHRSLLAREEQERIAADAPVEKFFSQLQQGEPDTLQARLYRAGFFHPSAPMLFYLIRFGLCAAVFVPSFLLARYLFPGVPLVTIFLPTLLYSLAFIILPSIALDRLAKKREESCRRGFPDFMDLMIVCADAGMSLEAAAHRVSEEIATTHKALGIHLKILVLEMRAGRPLRDALHNLAHRLDFDEAKTLAVLFRQSEELGTSLTQTLRVYSDEMREKRIVRAEEKANALPVKVVLPLGLFIFPVILAMVMLPLLIRMHGVFF